MALWDLPAIQVWISVWPWMGGNWFFCHIILTYLGDGLKARLICREKQNVNLRGPDGLSRLEYISYCSYSSTQRLNLLAPQTSSIVRKILCNGFTIKNSMLFYTISCHPKWLTCFYVHVVLWTSPEDAGLETRILAGRLERLGIQTRIFCFAPYILASTCEYNESFG